MIRRIIKLSITFISIVILNVSCEGDDLVSYSPPSPVNIENAIIFNPDLKYGTVVDIDGNIYKTIKIGTKTWMAENLRVTRFRNGDIIPTIYSASAWINERGVLGLCAYDNNYSKELIAKHGLLYGSLVMTDDRNVAPIGWHVATGSEWYDILNSLRKATLIGVEWGTYSEKDKEIINNSGLTLLSSGYRDNDGNFQGRGREFYTNSWLRIFWDGYFMYFDLNKWSSVSRCWEAGYSIRCVKD